MSFKSSKAILKISIYAPRGGSDLQFLLSSGTPTYFNLRSPWGERLGIINTRYFQFSISTYAPRGGSDLSGKTAYNKGKISIYAPRGGSDGKSKPPKIAVTDFNLRSPWGERHW